MPRLINVTDIPINKRVRGLRAYRGKLTAQLNIPGISKNQIAEITKRLARVEESLQGLR